MQEGRGTDCKSSQQAGDSINWSDLLYRLLNPLAGTTDRSCLPNFLPFAENIAQYVLTASKSTAPLLSAVVPGHLDVKLKEIVLNENTSDTSY